MSERMKPHNIIMGEADLKRLKALRKRRGGLSGSAVIRQLILEEYRRK